MARVSASDQRSTGIDAASSARLPSVWERLTRSRATEVQRHGEIELSSPMTRRLLFDLRLVAWCGPDGEVSTASR
jgi:hypothetical protein